MSVVVVVVDDELFAAPTHRASCGRMSFLVVSVSASCLVQLQHRMTKPGTFKKCFTGGCTNRQNLPSQTFRVSQTEKPPFNRTDPFVAVAVVAWRGRAGQVAFGHDRSGRRVRVRGPVTCVARRREEGSSCSAGGRDRGRRLGRLLHRYDASERAGAPRRALARPAWLKLRKKKPRG